MRPGSERNSGGVPPDRRPLTTWLGGSYLDPYSPRPMIARIWRGAVRIEDADAYARYIRDTGFAEYGRTAGNCGAWMLRRDDGGETEFLTLSMWASREAIKAFAGEDIEAAVLYPEDERYLIGGKSSIAHYKVVDTA